MIEAHTDSTSPMCPVRVNLADDDWPVIICQIFFNVDLLVITFQILTDLSELQLASLEPSGLKQTPRTVPECPLRVHFTRPVFLSTIFTV